MGPVSEPNTRGQSAEISQEQDQGQGGTPQQDLTEVEALGSSDIPANVLRDLNAQSSERSSAMQGLESGLKAGSDVRFHPDRIPDPELRAIATAYDGLRDAPNLENFMELRERIAALSPDQRAEFTDTILSWTTHTDMQEEFRLEFAGLIIKPDGDLSLQKLTADGDIDVAQFDQVREAYRSATDALLQQDVDTQADIERSVATNTDRTIDQDDKAEGEPEEQPVVSTEPTAQQVAAAREAATSLDEAMNLGWNRFFGTDETKVLQSLEGRSAGEIALIRQEYARIVEARTGQVGSLDADLASELGGNDYFRAQEALRGVPETPSEMLAAAERRYEHETSGVMNWAAGLFSDRDEKLASAIQNAREYNLAIGKDPTPEQASKMNSYLGLVQDAAEKYSETKAERAGWWGCIGATVAGIGVGVGMIATAPFSLTALAAGAAGAVAYAGIKGLFMGSSYTAAEFGSDLVKGGLWGALGTVGFGAVRGAAQLAGPAFRLAASALRAAPGVIGETASTAWTAGSRLAIRVGGQLVGVGRTVVARAVELGAQAGPAIRTGLSTVARFAEPITAPLSRAASSVTSFVNRNGGAIAGWYVVGRATSLLTGLFSGGGQQSPQVNGAAGQFATDRDRNGQQDNLPS